MMRIDDALRERGFRRWYERHLIEGHAYLVTGILSLIMMVIALEVIAFRESVANALLLAFIAGAGGGVAIFAWKRFSAMLLQAETLASQAVCAQCSTYGRFEVVEARDAAGTLFGRRLTVRCRHCGHQWTMGEGERRSD